MDAFNQTVDCVIIGVNAEATLERCIKSVFDSDYPRGNIHVFYVDGGSTDRSIEIARNFQDVHVIELHPQFPTPGLGRNAGWRKSASSFVQFLDSDTILHPQWLKNAVQAMTDRVGAVRGYRKEIHPDASIYNRIADLEWNATPGECDSFGGDCLIRRSVLEETGGYDEELVAGEDPDLSQRIRIKGWKILQIDTTMTFHDIGMKKISQYLKRGYRTGYGYGAVGARYAFSGQGAGGFWLKELARIIVRGGGGTALFFMALFASAFSPWFSLLFIPAFALVFYPSLFSMSYFSREMGLKPQDARRYALHCSLVVIPQFLGIMRFFLGKIIGMPLRNKRTLLGTRASR
jgi:glycosyltransferase involved in cell wall biosynthesis